MSQPSATLEPNNSSASTTAPDKAAAPAAKPAGCPKCGSLESWGTASWCPKCGYYPRLNSSTGEAGSWADADEQSAPMSRLEALAKVPQWARVLAAGCAAIFFVSVVVRVVTPDKSFSRSLWSVLQLFIGGATFLAMHIYTGLKTVMGNDRHGYIDIIVHPIEIWRPTFRGLPATARRIWIGVWGFTAAMCAMLVIGGIRYSVLTDDWGFKQRPKQNLMKQIVKNLKDTAEEGAENMEDAVKDFVGDMEDSTKKDNKSKEDEYPLEAECVVAGYNVDKDTKLVTELILASVVDDKLQYVGTISFGGLPPKIQIELSKRLPKLHRKQPIVLSTRSATWIRPVIACRIAFKSWSKAKQFEKPIFREQLADVGK